MTPEIVIALALIQHGPALARSIAAAFQKETITREDWEAVFAVYKTRYEDYVNPPSPPV